MRERLAQVLAPPPGPTGVQSTIAANWSRASRNNLATSLRNQGRYGGAGTCSSSMEEVRQLKGDEYIDVANAQSNLGIFYLPRANWTRPTRN